MADINASFEYDANFGPAIAQIKSLAREISVLNNSFNSLDKAALSAKKQLATSFQTNISSLGGFQAKVVDLSSDVDRFGEALQKNKLHMRDYFREARKAYTEGSKVRQLAAEQVRRAQSEIVSLGRDATGRNKGMMITPLSVDTKNIQTSMMIAREQFNIFNKLVQDGSRELINWGKNTQWAGRQLTVGLTVPLTIFGSTLSRTFRDFDRELTRFQKVYGSDLVNTTVEASNEMRKQVELLSKDIASKFGIAVSETAALAADLAATGLEGQRLTSSIEQTTRLAVLGEVNRQEAMKATLALQNAFNMSTQELAESINFLNAVENQTSVSIADLTEAIPRTGPVINALGGDVKDLAVLLVAMKEGGISAAEGANAIKSGMASLINPTKQAAETARSFGIDLEGIVTRNKGKLMPTILEFQSALKGLDEFARAQIIEQVFGKYQFARIAALFDNLNQSGSQTVQVIKLMSASSSELAATANAELRTLTESTSMRFQRAMESIKAALLPVGEALTNAVIPFLEKAADLFNKIVEYGRGLPEPIKNFLKIATGFTALAGPVVMIAGVLANFLGYVTKGAMGIVNLGRAISGMPTKQFELLNDEQIIALKTTDNLTAAYSRQDSVLAKLNGTMATYLAALRTQAATNPGMMIPGTRPIRRARGGGVPGSGNTDSVPALLMPGEFVVNKKATQKYGPIINAMNNGTIKGFEDGGIAGYNVDLSKINLRSVPTLERELSIRPDLANEIQQVFDEISDGLDKTKLNTAEVLEMINQKAREAQKIPVGRVQETRYNASSAGERRGLIPQLRQERPEEATAEVRRAAAGAREIRKQLLTEWGITEEQLLLEENAQKKKLLDSRVQLDRAHIVTLENAEKGIRSAWNSDLWKTQTGVENVFSEMMRSSSRNQEAYLKILNEVEPDVAVRTAMEKKITSGIALTEKEIQIQRKVLERMIAAQASYGAGSVSPQFFSTAPSVVASARGREASNVQINERDIILAEEKKQQVIIDAQNKGKEKANNATKNKVRSNSDSKETIQTGKDTTNGMATGMLSNISKVEDAGERVAETALSGVSKAKKRATSAGRSIISRGAGIATPVMGATIALNSISMMNEGFANATRGLTNFTNGLMAATSVMQLMQMSGGGGGIGGRIRGLGQRTIVRGRAMSIASGGSSVAGRGLMAAGRSLALLGGPYGAAALATVAAVTFAIVKYKQSLVDARKAGESMFASQTAAAEYYGITLKTVNDQLKANADIAKNLGLSKPGALPTTIDPALKESILAQEENKKLVEEIKKSNDPAAIFLGQYGKMLQEGFSAEQAKTILSILAQAAGKTGDLSKISGQLANITTPEQSMGAITQAFQRMLQSQRTGGGVEQRTYRDPLTGNTLTDANVGNRVVITQQQWDTMTERQRSNANYAIDTGTRVTQAQVDFTDPKVKEKITGMFSNAISAALTSPDTGAAFESLNKMVTSTFAEATAAGISDKDFNNKAGQALDKSIKDQLAKLDNVDPQVIDMIDRLSENADDTQKKLILAQAAANGIDLSRFLQDGQLANNELDQIKTKLMQIDAAAQIDMQLDAQLQNEIDYLNKLKETESARFDNLIAKNQEAMDAEQERHENLAKNIDKENEAIQKQIDQIQEGADKYIEAIERESDAESFRQQQRTTALGGLSALSQGDVFGFIQAQQDLAAGAAEQGRQSELDAIKKQAEDAVNALEDQIEKNRELLDGEDERHEARIKQLEDENAAIQANKAATIQAIDAAVQQAQVLKDLQPGQALSKDMEKYIGTLGTLATKLPPQAQKLVSDMAKTFNEDFNKIVNDAIVSAGSQYGINDTATLKNLIKSSIGRSGADIPPHLRANGGLIQGPGTATSDSIPARLSNGEYVVRASAVKEYGTGLLNQINERKFAKGGYVSATARGTQTGDALGYGQVTYTAVKSGIGKAVQDALAAIEAENADSPGNGSTISNSQLLGAIAKILLGSFPVTGRQVYSSGLSHRARYPGRAIDYATPSGTPVYAMASGAATVQDLGRNSFGKYVAIRHADGTESVYAHLSAFSVGTGNVSAGQRIGSTGNSGNSTGPHLHFEWSGLTPGQNPPGMMKGGITKSNGLANLHRGEAVLTAPLTKDLKAGVQAMKYAIPQQNKVPVNTSNIASNIQYNVSVNGINMSNPKQVANEVINALRVENSKRDFGRRFS